MNAQFSPEIQAVIDAAATRGAREALRSVGLHDEDAVKDVVELRGLLDSYRALKHGAMNALGKAIAVALLGGLLLWLGIEKRIFS